MRRTAWALGWGATAMLVAVAVPVGGAMAAEPTIVVDLGTIEAAIATPAAAERARTLRAEIVRGGVPKLAGDSTLASDAGASGLGARDAQAVTRAIVDEWAALQVVDALRASGPNARAIPALEQLAARDPIVYTQHPESAAEWPVVVFDVPARAAGTLEHWRAEVAARDFLESSKAGGRSFDALDDRAKVRAIELADRGALGAIVASSLAAKVTLPAGYWTALAKRTRDRAVVAAGIARGAPVDRITLVSDAPSLLARADALAVLDAALSDDTLASAAVSSIARLDPKSDRLHTLLGDARLGESAAAAIATRANAATVERLSKRLASDATPLEHRHVALALRLIGTSSARDAAKRYTGPDAALAREVASW